MQTQIHVLDWTVDAAAKIVENDDYIVSMYDNDGDYDVAYIRAKRLQPDAIERAGRAAAMREARVAFTLAMRGRS